MFKTTTVTVPSDGSKSKSAMINAKELLEGFEDPDPIVSLAFAADLEGTEAKLRWYFSLTGTADSELPIYKDGALAETSGIGTNRGVEVDIQRFLRWPYLVFEFITAAGAAVPHTSDRDVDVVAASI
ncbi:MAG: hypothetical protein GY906_11550 [bacterium]|nr:hypothetical protein [bacterium]